MMRNRLLAPRSPKEAAVKEQPPLSKHSQKSMNPAKVPEALHPLLPFVQTWGAVASDEERYNVADFANQSEARIAILGGWTQSWTSEMDAAYERPSQAERLV
jgi:hypothetical protein